MVRPREFDRDEALERATHVFWAKGYAGASTEDLLGAMNIGRQSLYNAFGDKRKLYLEAMQRYQLHSVAGHIARLAGAASVVAGLEALLYGVVPDHGPTRELGCFGVNAVCEFGSGDPELVAMRARTGPMLQKRIAQRIAEGQANGELDAKMEPREAAGFVLMTMQSLQVAARAGTDVKSLRTVARFAIERLKARDTLRA
jgi:TetR/AcrR family transcriptional regulator, transcriptional repressor for nem operon